MRKSGTQVWSALSIVALAGAGVAGCGSNGASEDVAGAPRAKMGNAASPMTPAKAPANALPAGWETFTSKDGGYTVAAPGKLKTSSQQVKTAVGNIKMNMALLSKKNTAYLAIHADYPAVTLKADPQKILDGARNGAIKQMGASATGYKKITINGFPGQEFSGTTKLENVPAFVTARIYLVRQRLYQQIVVGPEDEKSTKDIDLFFKSFKIQAKK